MYRRFPILEVARRCGLSINEKTRKHVEVEATCPFCGDHGPGKYHLFLNTERDQYWCGLCGATGNSVTLYARMKGVDNKKAVEELDEDDNIRPFPSAPRAAPAPEPFIKSLAERHDAYYDMLQHLALTPKHREDLRRRGLTDEQIDRNMYRSMPATEQARQHLAWILNDFHDLHGIPGFYTTARGAWSMSPQQGLMIPACNKEGYIQGLQIRLDNESNPKRKYRWFSSRYMKDGTRGRSWIHITGDVTARTAYLTEGGLKGDVASALSGGKLYICIAGVNALKDLETVLLGLDINELVIAMDMDKVCNSNVQAALEKIVGTVGAIPGLRLRPFNWDPGIKGVDDFMLALRKGYRPMRYPPTPITQYMERRWDQSCPGQDKAFIELCPWEEQEVELSSLQCERLKKDEEPIVAERVNQFSGGGAQDLPPIIAINSTAATADKLRYWTYARAGVKKVRVYQNIPWQPEVLAA